MNKGIDNIERTCDNCHFLYHSNLNEVYFCAKHKANKEKPKEVCEYHGLSCHKCSCEAEFIYNDDMYCLGCLLEENDVEECTTTSYYVDGEYLGADDDMDEVLENLSNYVHGEITMLDT